MAWKGPGSLGQLQGSLVGMALLGCRKGMEKSELLTPNFGAPLSQQLSLEQRIVREGGKIFSLDPADL